VADLQWDNLIIEGRAAPPPIDEARFRAWMQDRPIFVSSTMDDEMSPARSALRTAIRSWGAEPVMWEEITPRDQGPRDAYLEGVDRSQIVLLLLGKRYGVSDESGYSPTHQEARRAAQQGILRLLWEPAGISGGERDGRLNDWLRSLYNEVSAGKYADPQDLVSQLERRLREVASAQESVWVKLGPVVFPGQVAWRTSRGSAVFEVTTSVREGAVRRTLAAAGQFSNRVRLDRLTWGVESHEVDVETSDVRSVAASEDVATLSCVPPRNRGGGWSLGGVNYVDQSGRTFGPAAQAELWAARALFGTGSAGPPGRDTFDLMQSMTAPDGPVLPDLLQRHRAQGWLAEGLTRLYLVEGLIPRFGGHFDRLEVGPATAAGVRVLASFVPETLRPETGTIRGTVPLGIPRAA